MKRLALICEVLHPPLDEGIRIVAAELASAFSRICDVDLIGEYDAEVRGLPVRGVLTDRFFVGRALAAELSRFSPEAILYVPWTSLTARSLFRIGMLRRRAPGSPVGVLALQPRGAGWTQRLAVRTGRPDRVFAFGPEVESQAAALEIPCQRLQGGVDLSRFRPFEEHGRADLRRSLGLPLSAFIVLHVGHLKPGRGVGALKGVQALEGVQALLIASTSTEPDAGTRRDLQSAGVRVLDQHQERIEEFYRAADAYLFPVSSATDSIELPLSVLEAMACNLPIITTPFGGLPSLLAGVRTGVTFVDSESAIPRAVVECMRERPRPDLRGLVDSLSWDAMADRILGSLRGAAAGAAREAEEARA